MNVALRIQTCLLLEQMDNDKEYARKLGLKDKSKFQGKKIIENNKRKIRK